MPISCIGTQKIQRYFHLDITKMSNHLLQTYSVAKVCISTLCIIRNVHRYIVSEILTYMIACILSFECSVFIIYPLKHYSIMRTILAHISCDLLRSYEILKAYKVTY